MCVVTLGPALCVLVRVQDVSSKQPADGPRVSVSMWRVYVFVYEYVCVCVSHLAACNQDTNVVTQLGTTWGPGGGTSGRRGTSLHTHTHTQATSVHTKLSPLPWLHAFIAFGRLLAACAGP